MKQTSLKEIRRQASMQLQDQREADILICHALGQDRTFLYTHDQDWLTEAQIARIAALVQSRQRGDPIAYLLGHKEFYGRSFLVDANVLIPRPETEGLIEVIQSLPLPEQTTALDLGTGSGCIGLTLALEHPEWNICLSDLSEDALSICKKNRDRLAVSNVALYQGALLTPVTGQTFDLIVANLPYIDPDDPHLRQGDLRFEPNMALVAEDRGLSLIKALIKTAPSYLNASGYLVLEHGFDQQPAIIDLLRQIGFDEIRGHTDLAGQPRLVVAKWPLAN